MRYTDLDLLAREPAIVKADGKKRLTFTLLVPKILEAATQCELDLRNVTELKKKATSADVTWEDAAQLGTVLSAALFPTEIFNLVSSRITQAQAGNEGLRIRLILSGSELNNLPWEFLILNRGGGEAKRSDFLCLMPNVSVVRHPSTPLPPWSLEATLPVKVMVAAASPDHWPPLEVSKELLMIEKALEDNPQVTVSTLEHAQKSGLPNKAKPAHVFHFAGHGQFEGLQSQVPGAYEGKSGIVLEDGYGDPDVMDAESLAVQLRDAGVRVAVLGACQTAQRDDVNAWSSVAEALLKAELGAVVGMQFPVGDDSAICFAENFYAALAIGLSIDESVSAGRVAVAGLDDPRGWANPTLYLRAPDGVIFPTIAKDPSLAEARQQATVIISQRIKVLSGMAIAIEVDELAPGASVKGEQDIGVVKEGGIAIGGKFGVVGGNVQVEQKIDEAQGDVIGISIDKLG
jgi:hypothetical protein